MAPSNRIPPATPKETNTAMQVTSADIRKTIARTREVLQQSREVLEKVNRVLNEQPEGNVPKSSASRR